jgi:hypothetical protein
VPPRGRCLAAGPGRTGDGVPRVALRARAALRGLERRQRRTTGRAVRHGPTCGAEAQVTGPDQPSRARAWPQVPGWGPGPLGSWRQRVVGRWDGCAATTSAATGTRARHHGQSAASGVPTTSTPWPQARLARTLSGARGRHAVAAGTRAGRETSGTRAPSTPASAESRSPDTARRPTGRGPRGASTGASCARGRTARAGRGLTGARLTPRAGTLPPRTSTGAYTRPPHARQRVLPDADVDCQLWPHGQRTT